MRAVVTKISPDPAEAIASVRIEQQPAIDVSKVGSGDVVVAVRSSAVHWVDNLMLSGQYQHQPELPYTPGMEYAGEITWRGADVSSTFLQPNPWRVYARECGCVWLHVRVCLWVRVWTVCMTDRVCHCLQMYARAIAL